MNCHRTFQADIDFWNNKGLTSRVLNCRTTWRTNRPIKWRNMRNRHHTHVQSIINICSTRPHQVFHTTKYFSSIFLLYPHFHKLQNWTQKVRLTVIFQISGGGTKFVIRSVGGHDGELWMLDDWIKIPVGSPVQLSSAKVKKGDLNRGGGARSRDVIAPGVESLPPRVYGRWQPGTPHF